MAIKPQTYVPNPGEGALFFVKNASPEVALWGGNLKLNNGVETRMDAKVIRTPGKKPHFEVEVREIAEPGVPWKRLAEFQMKSFGGKLNKAQDVKIPGIGKAKAWVRASGNSQFIKFQLVDSPRPVVTVP